MMFREELQSYKDAARLVNQNGGGISAVLGAGRIAQLEAELRDAKVARTLSVSIIDFMMSALLEQSLIFIRYRLEYYSWQA